MPFEKVIVVDAREHLLGRLASVIAKEMLQGQRVVVVRCEDIVLSGSHLRNKMKFLRFLRKRTNTNPKRGPIHYRAPSRILWRTIRGMIPHKTSRGEAAMRNLKVFDGVPHPYDAMKRQVVPAALKMTHSAPGRKTSHLGKLASQLGWKHLELVNKLEAKRKVRAEAWYAKQKASKALRAKAVAETDLSAVNEVLAASGYAL